MTVLYLPLLVAAVMAQAPDANALPVSKLPLLVTPPAVQFLVLAHERGPNPKNGKADRHVTLWEIQPSRATDQAVRRCVLGRSPWNAAPLLDSVELLRWQIPSPAGPRGYSVKLLQVDGRTFEIKELLAVPQAHAFGRSSSAIYLNTSDGQCTLDLGTGAIVSLSPKIRRLAQQGDDWLVVSNGILARFDAKAQKITRQYDAIKVPANRQQYDSVDWDGGRFAVSHAHYVDEDGKGVFGIDYRRAGIVYLELHVWNLQKGTERPLRVRLQARGGSGIGVIPTAVHTELLGAIFRYTERIDPGVDADLKAFDWEEDTEWVTIEISTGKELLREPYADSPVASIPPGRDERIPPYLQDLFEQSPIRAWGSDQDLAYAFLLHVGLLKPVLAKDGAVKLDAVCRVAGSDELLVLHAGQFYHCNLKTKAVNQWAAPKDLHNVSVDLHAVTLR